jgi:hypothetical protein
VGVSNDDSEIPLPLSFFYLFDEAEMVREDAFWSQHRHSLVVDLCQRHAKMGSLAGAAHLLNNDAGVQR